MKWLIKFTTYALLLLLLLFIFTYIGLQTRWGASYSSQFLSKFRDLHEAKRRLEVLYQCSQALLM